MILYLGGLWPAWVKAAEINKSVSYTLSVTIPPHVVIPKTAITPETQNRTGYFSGYNDQETFREKILRNNQPAILETTTVK